MSDRPFILWKCAASLDGRIAAADGSSKWITSAEARADGHRLRAECGAVMVGSGTQQADDPQLAVRDAEVTRQPLRIVVDSNARTPASARVLDDAAPTLIAVADDADVSHLEGRADIVRLPRVDAGLDLDLLLKALSERGVRAILLEGGPTLVGSFLAAGLIDQVVAGPHRWRWQAGTGRVGRTQYRRRQALPTGGRRTHRSRCAADHHAVA
jgi:diaminohydroxyphosphoribosylaminopyrimidine deaminase / 5-amino-6-(5-phosphoribosylamino)uracil reductase